MAQRKYRDRTNNVRTKYPFWALNQNKWFQTKSLYVSPGPALAQKPLGTYYDQILSEHVTWFKHVHAIILNDFKPPYERKLVLFFYKTRFPAIFLIQFLSGLVYVHTVHVWHSIRLGYNIKIPKFNRCLFLFSHILGPLLNEKYLFENIMLKQINNKSTQFENDYHV